MKRLFELTVSEFQQIIAKEIQNQKPSKGTKSKEWVTRAEACELLNISYPTLHKLVKNHRITPHKVGRRVHFSSDEIQQLIIDSRIG